MNASRQSGRAERPPGAVAERRRQGPRWRLDDGHPAGGATSCAGMSRRAQNADNRETRSGRCPGSGRRTLLASRCSLPNRSRARFDPFVAQAALWHHRREGGWRRAARRPGQQAPRPDSRDPFRAFQPRTILLSSLWADMTESGHARCVPGHLRTGFDGRHLAPGPF